MFLVKNKQILQEKFKLAIKLLETNSDKFNAVYYKMKIKF